MFASLLKNYLKKLVNLSGSNRALVLLKLSKENDLDLHSADYLVNASSFALIEQLIAGKAKIAVATRLDSRDAFANRIARQLQKINRKDQFLFEESGTKDLYVGWPFARGLFSDGTPCRCPLLFFPVEIREEENNWFMFPRESETVSINKSFLLAWSHYNQLPLSEELFEASLEGFSNDAKEFRTQLYGLLKDNGMELDFNSELFVDKLLPFRDFDSVEFSREMEVGCIKLYSEAVLGIFPQASSYLVPDYEQLLANSVYSTADDFFLGKIDDASLGKETIVKEADIHTPLLLDASQEYALRQVKQGNSIVVQGPPGTGKSQLICNLVADFISRGKKVLVVCQKRAALDVVYHRLEEEVGIPHFLALVHDFKADRGAIYEKVALQIGKVDEYKRDNGALDTIFLERNYLHACKRIDHATAELEQLKQALFDINECGISIKELYLSTRVDLPYMSGVEGFYKHFSYEQLESFNERLKFLLPYALEFDKPSHAWYMRKSFKAYATKEKSDLGVGLGAINRFRETIAVVSLKFNMTIPEFWELRRHLPLLLEISEKAQNPVFYQHFQKYILTSEVEARLAKWHKRLNRFEEELVGLSDKRLVSNVHVERLPHYFEMVGKASQLLGSFAGSVVWKWFFKERKEIQALLRDNQLEETHNGVKELLERLHSTKRFFLIKEELIKSKEFEIDQEENVTSYLEALEQIRRALFSTEHWLMAHRELPFPIVFKKLSHQEFLQIIATLQGTITKVEQAYVSHLTYFQEEHLHVLFAQDNFVYQALQELDSAFESIAEYDKAKESLSYYENMALQSMLRYMWENEDAANSLQAAEVLELFNNSLRRAWIEHIENRFPVLRVVSTATIELLEQELNVAMREKRNLSKELLLLKLREALYRDEEFNRLGNRTTFRDLHHQVVKKKKIWPLRKVVMAFHEELFRLLPCWLASPETVSALFPMEPLFDLVIFDESSQCFAEKGIPSIARGKQVVIAGDSKQLQPSDLYKVRFSGEGEDLPESEIDSLLDLGGRYFPSTMLTEHYRSRSLDLIDFSNTHFYKGKLQLLPHSNTFEKEYRGIVFIKSDGFLEQQCNRIEADRVVSLCLELFVKHPEKSIGVIAFNVHQQHLILDLLEEKMMTERKTLPPLFFVKNIENIQGDERDIVVFSIGYAPDRSGRFLHSFGSLNQEGGENRLNVAVTRAREKIFVVSSIFPQQLKVENAVNQGPRLLKKYLEYALEVSEGRFSPTLHPSKVFRGDWFLKTKLKQRSPFLSEEIPFADLVQINRQGQYEKLILTDDDKLYDAHSVKGVFAYLPTTLHAKNWKFERKWSRNEFNSIGLRDNV